MDIERAGERTLTLNPVIGISRDDLVEAASSVARACRATHQVQPRS
jgi:hypothetical protein